MVEPVHRYELRKRPTDVKNHSSKSKKKNVTKKCKAKNASKRSNAAKKEKPAEVVHERSTSNILNGVLPKIFVDVCSFLDRPFVQNLCTVNAQLNQLVSQNLNDCPPFLGVPEFCIDIKGCYAKEISFPRPMNPLIIKPRLVGPRYVGCLLKEFLDNGWFERMPPYLCFKKIVLFICMRTYKLDAEDERVLGELLKRACHFDITGSPSVEALQKLLALSKTVPSVSLHTHGAFGAYRWLRIRNVPERRFVHKYKPDKRFINEPTPSAEERASEVNMIVEWLHSTELMGPSCLRKSDTRIVPRRMFAVNGNTILTRGPKRSIFIRALLETLEKRFLADDVKHSYELSVHTWWLQYDNVNAHERKNKFTGKVFKIWAPSSDDIRIHASRFHNDNPSFIQKYCSLM